MTKITTLIRLLTDVKKPKKKREQILKKTAHQYNSNPLSCKKNNDVPNNSRYRFAAIKNVQRELPQRSITPISRIENDCCYKYGEYCSAMEFHLHIDRSLRNCQPGQDRLKCCLPFGALLEVAIMMRPLWKRLVKRLRRIIASAMSVTCNKNYTTFNQ